MGGAQQQSVSSAWHANNAHASQMHMETLGRAMRAAEILEWGTKGRCVGVMMGTQLVVQLPACISQLSTTTLHPLSRITLARKTMVLQTWETQIKVTVLWAVACRAQALLSAAQPCWPAARTRASHGDHCRGPPSPAWQCRAQARESHCDMRRPPVPPMLCARYRREAVLQLSWRCEAEPRWQRCIRCGQAPATTSALPWCEVPLRARPQPPQASA